jgi:hypothetical protein
MMQKLRFVVPYSWFQAFDKRGEEVAAKLVANPWGEPTELWWKFRRVVSDGTNQWWYWVESHNPHPVSSC